MIFVETDPRALRLHVRFESRSEPGRTHDTTLDVHGVWSCECWPWHRWDDCLHVQAIRRWLKKGRTMKQGDLERWAIACLRNALAKARDCGGAAADVAVPYAVAHVENTRGRWDDGLDALRDRLKAGVADPLEEIRAELRRLGHTGDDA